MNKTIRTRAGLITGTAVILLVLFLRLLGVPDNSPLVLLQFGLVLLGLLASSFFLHKYYAGVTFMEGLTHCTRTLATCLVVVLLGYTAIYWGSNAGKAQWNEYNFMLMKLLFSFAVSGLLSSFFASYIFYTFTRNKSH
ncbi:MAG: hypothetical protein ACR2IL_10440 [Chitinophagaceae bacterium]